MNLDIKKLESLLEANKYDEAKKLISDELSREMTQKEEGEALVSLASVYMEVSNQINSKYKEFLKEAVREVSDINKLEVSIQDKAKLADVRKGLK